MKTLIYLTDNSLAEPLASKCRDLLKRESKDIPIISVSQEPIDLGTNICVGKIGRSWLSLYKQMMKGIEATTTPYLGICEHDCLYSGEHLAWIPPTTDTFYYNYNHWFVYWADRHQGIRGMYSYIKRRHALSQLVCSRDLLKKSIDERLCLLLNGYVMNRGLAGAGEPGVVDKIAIVKAQQRASSGEPYQLQQFLHGAFTDFKSSSFETKICNLDIRHNNNFTGQRRGKRRCYEMPYWGKFAELMEAA